MTGINALRNIAGPRDFIAWGKNIEGSISAFVFAAVLIVCSVTVGCSSSNEKPKPLSSNNQIPAPQIQSPAAPAPVMQAESKLAPKKIVHKKPATVNYTDKTYGLTFEYSRRYAIETGNAASDVVASSPLPMNFVAPGGVALAAVELPQTGFANTDFSSAFFDVSVNKSLTADQCNEFAVPQPKVAVPVAASAEAASAPVAETASVSSATATPSPEQPAAAQSAAETATGNAEPASAAKASDAAAPAASAEPASGSKLLVGDLELRGTEAVSGEGTRQSDAKYFHVYQNGACYEFALNLTTVASEEGMTKHVDRDKVFSRLETILGTVKISPVTPEVTAQAPATPAAPETPAQ